MRFLANENVSGAVIRGLRGLGHDVLSVKESMRAAEDRAVLARAVKETRLLVTHDKDFGELAFRSGLPASSGVVLLRLAGRSAAADDRRALEVLSGRSDLAGHFCVVTSDRVRVRPLPSLASRRGRP